MADLNETAMAGLAREMAINIRPYKVVFADYGISEEDFYEISKHEFFKRAKEQYALAWNATESAADRVRLQAAAGSELILPVMVNRAMDANESLSNATEAAKFVAKLAGLGEVKISPASASDRFVITINLGADVETYNKSIAIDPNDIDPSKLITVNK
jgi:hypothetical protein